MNFTFTRHKFLLVTVKEWLKSVLNYRSYPKNKTGYPFFGPPCIPPLRRPPLFSHYPTGPSPTLTSCCFATQIDRQTTDYRPKDALQRCCSASKQKVIKSSTGTFLVARETNMSVFVPNINFLSDTAPYKITVKNELCRKIYVSRNFPSFVQIAIWWNVFDALQLARLWHDVLSVRPPVCLYRMYCG